MSAFDLSMTSREIEATGFFLGLGQALIFNPLAVLAYATLGVSHRTEGAVFQTMFRTVAGSIGIALMQGGLLHQNAVAHEALSARLSPADPVIGWAMPNLLDGRTGSLEAVNAEVVRQGAMLAYTSVFAWMALSSLALLPMLMFLKAGKMPSGPPSLREVHVD